MVNRLLWWIYRCTGVSFLFSLPFFCFTYGPRPSLHARLCVRMRPDVRLQLSSFLNLLSSELLVEVAGVVGNMFLPVESWQLPGCKLL